MTFLLSILAATMVSQILVPGTVDEVRAALKLARSEERSICIAGSRHAMGQQAFATDAILLDTRKLTRVLGFDAGRGLIEVEFSGPFDAFEVANTVGADVQLEYAFQ